MSSRGARLAIAIAAIVLVIVAAAGSYVVWTKLISPRMAADSGYTSAERLADRYGPVAIDKSDADADGDGIPNNEDILAGALAYVQTHPRYLSAYYQGGYPDDGYGVCTDVLAFALRDAGFDLQQLVDDDIRATPKEYDVDAPDSNIDFRRARNLRVFFGHNAVTLTNDTSEIEEWQGGDIVMFGEHTGIVSDRRNERGVPYLIHHDGVAQESYEQDVMETWGQVTGHFRMG